MSVTLNDGTTEVTIFASSLFRRKKWRIQNIPLVQAPPLALDLGLETDESEVVFMVDDTNWDLCDALQNPVQITASTYPEIKQGWYRMEKMQGQRKAGQLKKREVTFTVLRDFYYTP